MLATVGSTRTAKWEPGRDNTVVTWSLGKIGVLAREAKIHPKPGERWAVKVLKDTAPGERKGVYVLEPLHVLDETDEEIRQDPVVDEAVVESANALVELAVVSINPAASVSSVRDGNVVRYKIVTPDGEAMFGIKGKVIDAVRTLAATILARAGAACWVDVTGVTHVKCSECGADYSDPIDLENRTTPGGSEDGFDADEWRPIKRNYRTCPCGAKIFDKEEMDAE